MWKRFLKLFKRKQQLRSVTAISEEKLNELFQSAPDHPLFQALLAVVDRNVEDTLERTVDMDLSSEKHRWYLGGVEALLTLKRDLQEREQVARRKQAEKDKPENR